MLTAGCAKKETPKPKEAEAETASAPTSENVQQRILSFNLEGLTDKGEKKWEVKGESAEAISESEVKLDNIVAKSYGAEAEATITADKGVYNKAKNNVKLEENVRAVIENAEEMNNYIEFPSEVSGKPKDKESTGAVKKKTKTVITCDGNVEFDYEKNLAFFDKNVKVVSDYGQIDADRITIHLDSQTKKIVDIVAEGNVKITRGENITYSEKATYVELEKKVILTGKPRLVIYEEGDIQKKFMGQ